VSGRTQVNPGIGDTIWEIFIFSRMGDEMSLRSFYCAHFIAMKKLNFTVFILNVHKTKGKAFCLYTIWKILSFSWIEYHSARFTVLTLSQREIEFLEFLILSVECFKVNRNIGISLQNEQF